MQRVGVGGKRGLGGQELRQVLERGEHRGRGKSEPLRELRCEPLRGREVGAALRAGVGQQANIAPERLPVGTPPDADGPAGQRLARIPLALPEMQEASVAEAAGEPSQQSLRQLALLRRKRGVIPLGAFHVVDGHERRLPALRQADVVRHEVGIHPPPEIPNGCPLRVGVRLGDSRVLVHARQLHREREIHLAHVRVPDDRRRVARVGGARQRNVPFPREQARGGIETDPACARQESFSPGVKVGEVALRPGRTVPRLQVGGELDQIAGREARREAQVAQDLHQQPTRVATRALRALERRVGRLDAWLHPDEIADLVLQLLVHANQHVDRFLAGSDRRAEALEPGREQRPRRRGFEKWNQLLREGRRIRERREFGVRLDEEVERIDHRHVGREVDADVEAIGGLREHEPRDPIAVGILLPVQEVMFGLDIERIAQDRRAAMRRGPQPDFVRPQPNVAIEAVRRAVLEGNANGHHTSNRDSAAARTPGAAPRPTGGGPSGSTRRPRRSAAASRCAASRSRRRRGRSAVRPRCSSASSNRTRPSCISSRRRARRGA